ncbi:MAG: T9SS type A sorting domain-containing protein, partial [Flavobacteriaceae bacterium]|nr:T9SS type A sorting domain-containing protein [Flavobacteriaceae bacterium]
IDGVDVPNIFNGVPNEAAGQICAINFCPNDFETAADLSAYIEPLTAFNECNNECGLPSGVEPTPSENLLVQSTTSSMKLKAFPNPYKDMLNVNYQFDYDTDVSIKFFDLRGVLVINKEIKAYRAGDSKVETFNMRGRQDQVLFMQITTNREQAVKKIISTNKR